MSVNTTLLSKGLKQLLLLLTLLIASPITVNIGFKALNKYPDDSIWIAYLILAFAIILVLLTLYLGFKTFKILLNALFNDQS